MSIETRHPLPARLHTLAAMAGLLERLEASPPSADTGASAEQYRSVARCVQDLLANALAGAGLDESLHRLLRAAPHTADLYENLRYDMAGLCLQPLERALNAEMAATAAIAQARTGLKAG